MNAHAKLLKRVRSSIQGGQTLGEVVISLTEKPLKNLDSGRVKFLQTFIDTGQYGEFAKMISVIILENSREKVPTPPKSRGFKRRR